MGRKSLTRRIHASVSMNWPLRSADRPSRPPRDRKTRSAHRLAGPGRAGAARRSALARSGQGLPAAIGMCAYAEKAIFH